MPLPLELPTIQNWSCHNCGGCCRQHAVAITPEEHRLIAGQNWTAQDGIPATQPLFERVGLFPWSKWHRLAHQPDGACVFLDGYWWKGSVSIDWYDLYANYVGTTYCWVPSSQSGDWVTCSSP